MHSRSHNHASAVTVTAPTPSQAPQSSITIDRNSPQKLQMKHVFASIICVCIVVTTITYFRLQSFAFVSKPSNAVSLAAQLEQYNRLVIRTQELIRQYKGLTKQDYMPPDLSFQFASSASTASDTKTTSVLEKPVPPSSSIRRKDLKRKKAGKVSESSSVESVNKKSYASNPRDLVLGMAYEVDEKNIAIFIKSLRNVSNANCILFLREPIPTRVQELGFNYKIKLITMGKDKYPDHMTNYHPSTLRWQLFRSFFTDHDGYKMIYNRVFLLDVRDTYFQHDPFTFFSPDLSSLHVFQGVTSKNIGQCSWNKGWVEDCFGSKMLDSISSRMILCSGTVAGSMDRISEYIDYMGGIVAADPTYLSLTINTADTNGNRQQKTVNLAGKFPSCERNGVDQGVHNVLVHRGILEPVTVWAANDRTPVANLQAQVAGVHVSSQSISVTTQQDPKSSEVLIVHQYDRHPSLQHALFRRYVDWLNIDDFASLWSGEPSCQQYEYVDGYDAYAGRCDLSMKLGSSAGATTAAQCCQKCEDTEDCVSFAYALGQCYLKSCRDVDSNSQFSQDLQAMRQGKTLVKDPFAQIQGNIVTGRRKSPKK